MPYPSAWPVSWSSASQRLWHGMTLMRTYLAWRFALWPLLALPALFIVLPLADGALWRGAIRPSGDIAVKLLVAALAIAPLRALLPDAAWLRWLARRRRHIGVAAFLYAALHLAVFVPSIGRLDWILQGMAFASMWTGWLAFAVLLAVATISHDAAMRRLGRAWKAVQRLAWPAAALTLAHWLLLSASPVEAALHFLPLAGLQLWRWVLRPQRQA